MPRVPANEVDSERVRRHVSMLVDKGMPRRTIARRAGTVKSTIQDLLAGRRKLIGSDLEKRLLAVKYDPAAGLKGRYASDDQRMLRALNWRGYDNVTIAAGVGINENTVGRIINGQAWVTYDMHRRIRRYYARHWAFDGGNDRARLRAERRGFDPPVEWDGQPVAHGTLQAYLRGCHCEDCRAANAKSKAMYEMRLLQGTGPDTTDAEPARQHVLALTAQDMPLGAIADKAGVSRHYLQRLVHGVDGQVTRRIPTDVDERIRNVRYDPSFLKTGLRHPAGTQRRLRGLILMRWDPADIAAATGLKAQLIERIAAGKAKHITSRVYEAVKRFYDANWHVDGGSEDARRRAIRGRYVPGAAWSEATIDDPKARPRGVDESIYKEACY